MEGSRKRRRDSLLKTPDDDIHVELPDFKLTLPETLKDTLRNDHHLTVNEQTIPPLPRIPSATTVLAEYMEEVARTDADCVDELRSVVDGLKVYFNAGLKNILLYRCERPQFNAFLKKSPKAQACDVYGTEHLLRLFVRLPGLVARAQADKETVKVFETHFNNILRFIDERREAYIG